jgi:tRNA pseudouridine55 synthase
LTRARSRNVDGILLLDKPPGISSNHALQRVRRAFAAAKAGHTGNLDVAASGLLPLCLGEATKVCGFLLDADKRYQALVAFGAETSTGDVEGEVIRRTDRVPASATEIQAALAQLEGEQWQVPPMYSALKHHGQPLYRLARQGIEIERAPRRITIHALDLLRHEDGQALIDVRCTKGTYVRSLAVSLGELLGCGAHLAGLRRLEAGPYDITRAHPLSLFEPGAYPPEALAELLLPADSALTSLPALTLNGDTARRLGLGQRVRVPEATGPGVLVRLYDLDGRFLGVGECEADQMVRPRRLTASQPVTEMLESR